MIGTTNQNRWQSVTFRCFQLLLHYFHLIALRVICFPSLKKKLGTCDVESPCSNGFGRSSIHEWKNFDIDLLFVGVLICYVLWVLLYMFYGMFHLICCQRYLLVELLVFTKRGNLEFVSDVHLVQQLTKNAEE